MTKEDKKQLEEVRRKAMEVYRTLIDLGYLPPRNVHGGNLKCPSEALLWELAEKVWKDYPKVWAEASDLVCLKCIFEERCIYK